MTTRPGTRRNRAGKGPNAETPPTQRRSEQDKPSMTQETAVPAAGDVPAPASTSLSHILRIEYVAEEQLIQSLTQILEALQRRRDSPKRLRTARAAAPGRCVSLVTAMQIVQAALAPHPYEPSRTLGDTYASKFERELFQDRVRNGVVARRCAIDKKDIPAGEDHTHDDVRNATQAAAH